MGHGGVETNKGRGRWGLFRVGRDERVLASMADAHGGIARSHAAVVVAVK